MDFEEEIPIQVSFFSTAKRRSGRRSRLNNTTGSLELDQILRELDENKVSVQHHHRLDTSLDSGLLLQQQKKQRGHRKKQAASRLLLELKSELGPKFSLTEETKGNLRSKYGRLQKVHESSGCVPSDILRSKKNNPPSPTRSPMTSPRQMRLENKNRSKEAAENSRIDDQQVMSTPKATAINSVISPKATKMDPVISPLKMETTEEAMDIEVVPEVMIVDPKTSPTVVLVDMYKQNVAPNVNPVMLTIKKELIEEEDEVKVTVKEESNPFLTPTIPLPVLRGTIKEDVIPAGRRLSMRRLSMMTPPNPTAVKSPTISVPQLPVDLNLVKQEFTPIMVEASELQEVRPGVLMSKDYEDHEKFNALKHLTPGLLIWGVCSKYPLWPCMVCGDSSGVYLKQSEYSDFIEGQPCSGVNEVTGKRVNFKLHVRFFGPKGLSSWISPASHLVFDPMDIGEDLRDGTRISKKPVTEKTYAELNWAIEDAEIVAAEMDFGRRPQVFEGIINEQFNRWKEDKQAQLKDQYPKKQAITKEKRFSEVVASAHSIPSFPTLLPISSSKRRRSSVTSNASDNAPPRPLSLDSNTVTNRQKRIKLSTTPTPTLNDHDTSIQSSFSSALSTTSSGVSSMGKQSSSASSDTLSLSSVGLEEITDEETMQTAITPTITKKLKKEPKKSFAELKPKLREDEPKESVQERLARILKQIPLDILDCKKVKRDELCRNCTKGSDNGLLRPCVGSCGGWYHRKCLDTNCVSLERLRPKEDLRKVKKKPKGMQKNYKRLSVTDNVLEDEGVEVELEEEDDDDEEENVINSKGIKIPPLHITGDSSMHLMSSQSPLIPEEPYKCMSCRTGDLPQCFICHQDTKDSPSSSIAEMTLCSVSNCGRAFHFSCLDKWPQAKKRKDGFICPSHQCHLCISDDPRSQNFKQKSKQKLFKCILCPTAYHLEQNCMPAGTEIVGHLSIICQRHFPLASAVQETTSGGHRGKGGKVGHEENNNNNNNSLVVSKLNSRSNDDQQVPSTHLDSTTTVTTVIPEEETKKTVKKKYVNQPINVNWCFICARGGSLVCCDKCPSAFHAECLKFTEEETQKRTAEDQTFICEECELGRFPLYGELVWAKFGAYRWWPAVIMSEGQVPTNLSVLRRSRGEFCVKFLGSNDHAWIGRKRVFLYTDDDALLSVEKGGNMSPSPKKKIQKKKKGKASPMKELTSLGKTSAAKSGMDAAFRVSLLEARVLNEMLQERKQVRQQELSKLMRPVPYYKLKTNRPVAPVKLFELRATEETDMLCNCKAIEEPGRSEPVACGPSSECLNRLLMTECNPAYCPSGDRCDNQRLQRREYPSLDILRTEGKGWGLVANQDLKEGELVVEYVGELINNAEMRRRIAQKEAAKDDVYYFLTLTKDLIIDAERKGNMARFMNHSCDPNCESQKWTVNGNTRVGLFANRDIKANTELTFNYHWESTGTSSLTCQCGAKKCKGFIGSDSKRS